MRECTSARIVKFYEGILNSQHVLLVEHLAIPVVLLQQQIKTVTKSHH